ncbi:hypothetical protein [Anaeromyxobacter paludicola]|uniref:DUF2378 family protein n=1 Tax=Anaeromyxobacter paludicola TaxID=2918171 RepID=A0ABM7X7V7_9BACT|nr:hypothetical protein [Anaeromyxobacter paludicola]BDG07880.1 hypothetical protein AMPC_09930 [Anaeromyxobacter paludicola]
MSQPTPQVRAAHLQLLLAELLESAAASGPGAPFVPDPVRWRVQRSHRLAWLPAEDLVAICVAAEAALGRDGLERWGAGVLRRLLRAPLFRAFYEAALWFERREPGVLLSYAVQSWPLLYQDCGGLVVEARGDDFVRLVHQPVPALLRCETTLLPLLGAMAALPRQCGVEARTEADWRPDRERFVYTISW